MIANRKVFLSVLTLSASLSPATAQETDAKHAFVEANILNILYHELAHAVIDLMQVPIFGQEEDAADVMAVLLTDWLFEEETAQALAYDSAFGYINDLDQSEDVTYWAVHGPDEQRYYNHICLFYGANPEEREDLAEDLGLPEERADTCPDEYAQASDSWGMIFDEMADLKNGAQIKFRPSVHSASDQLTRVLQEEITSLNAELSLPQALGVSIGDCDEANAWYDPEDISITFCTEFIPHLESIFDQISGR